MLFWFVIFFSVFYFIIYSFLVPLVVSIITSREYEYFLMQYYGGAFTIVFIVLFAFLVDTFKSSKFVFFGRTKLSKLLSYIHA